MTAATAIAELKALGDSAKAAFFPRFFKTGAGEYGEGDRFLGVTVPQLRTLARTYHSLSLAQVERLLQSAYHEARLLGFLILTEQYKHGDEAARQQIVDFYLAHLDRANNWDLVDASCYKILGEHLLHRDRKILKQLARSGHLWSERVAIVSTLAFIRRHDFSTTLQLAEGFLTHSHDLMHKAVGWMLREVGNRDVNVLRAFLDLHAATMPRTMLRYAIEKFDEDTRLAYLAHKRAKGAR